MSIARVVGPERRLVVDLFFVGFLVRGMHTIVLESSNG